MSKSGKAIKAKADDLKEGDSVDNADRLIVRRKIGQGAYGKVWICYDTVLKHEVAVKTALVYENLGQEMEVYKVLQAKKPCLGCPRAFGNSTGKKNLPFFISLALEGESLRERLKNSRHVVVPKASVLSVAFHAIDAFDNVHGRDVIHVDVKPENIVYSETDYSIPLLLIDFGLSTIVTGSGQNRKYPDLKGCSTFNKMYASSYLYDMDPQPCEVDDLIALCYVLLELRNGKDYFNIDFEYTPVDELEQIREKKENFTLNFPTLLKEEDQFLVPLFEAVFSLKRYEKPNYEFLFDIIQHTEGYIIGAYRF